MKLTDVTALVPADVPISSMKFRDVELDLFRLEIRDIFALMAKAPGLVIAWNMSADDPDRIPAIISAIGHMGPDIVSRIVQSGLRASAEEIDGIGLSDDEETDILLAVLNHSVPRERLEKLMRELEKMSSRFAKLAG